MDLIDFLREYQQRWNKLPTEREMIEIGSRMEGSKGNPSLDYTTALPMGILGQYDKSIPNKVAVNKWTGDLGTLVHELEHQGVDNYQGLLTQGRGIDNSLGVNPISLNSNAKWWENKNLLDNQLRAKVLNSVIKPAREGKFEDVFTAGNATDTYHEGFANVAKYISTLPMNVDFKDTPYGKWLKEQGVYDYVIKTLEQRRMLPSTYEKPKQVNPKSSYARQALQYLGFKDPFEDTTKD